MVELSLLPSMFELPVTVREPPASMLRVAVPGAPASNSDTKKPVVIEPPDRMVTVALLSATVSTFVPTSAFTWPAISSVPPPSIKSLLPVPLTTVTPAPMVPVTPELT